MLSKFKTNKCVDLFIYLDELQWKPEYRKISESILFRRHIMQRGPQGIPTDL